MRRDHVRVGIFLGLALAGCDQLFGLKSVGNPPDASDASPKDGLADGPSASVVLVNQVTSGSNNATSLQASLPAAAMGDVLVMVGGGASYSLARPTGGGVTTWTAAAKSLTYTNVEIWYGVVDSAVSPVTIACSPSGDMWMSVSEWSGLMNGALAERGSNADGSASIAAPGSAGVGSLLTVDAPDLLIFGVSGVDTISTSVSDGSWKALDRTAGGSVKQAEWYQVVSPGQHMPQTTVTSNWDAVLAAFRANP